MLYTSILMVTLACARAVSLDDYMVIPSGYVHNECMHSLDQVCQLSLLCLCLNVIIYHDDCVK
jgi:hypothetical protein